MVGNITLAQEYMMKKFITKWKLDWWIKIMKMEAGCVRVV